MFFFFLLSWDLFQIGKKLNPKGPCLGKRKHLPNGEQSKYEWLSYDEVESMAISLGSALVDLIPITSYENECQPDKLKLLGIFSKNCIEWFVCDHAASAFNLTLVPFYDSLLNDAITFIFKETNLQVVAGSVEGIRSLLKNSYSLEHLKVLILFSDIIPNDIRETAQSHSIALYVFNDLIKSKVTTMPSSFGSTTRESISTLCYTSGTTGNPKGVILTHGNVVATVCGCIRGPLAYGPGGDLTISTKDKHMSYLPAAHVFERAITFLVFAHVKKKKGKLRF